MALQAIYQRRRQKIGLTALIDVLFLLLKFFMLTSGFITFHQIVLKTPVKTEAAVLSASKPVMAYLDASRQLTIDGQVFPLAGLVPETLAGQGWYAEGRPIVLIPQPDVPVQTIVSAFEHLADVGVHELTLGNAR
jgi:biopolymer transport protein ExbD